MSDTGALVIEVPDVPPTATVPQETEVESPSSPTAEGGKDALEEPKAKA